MSTVRALPPELEPLAELARDLRWTWSHAGDALFRSIDAPLWDQTRNPWFVLENVSRHRLEELSQDTSFRTRLRELVAARKAYMTTPGWVQAHGKPLEGRVAYFSMEFGLGEAIPLYAGGLGILAGDYLKTASDLGLPLVGVGILFQEGYFRQWINGAGLQHEAYPYNDPTTLPIEAVRDADGGWLRIPFELPGRRLWLRVWRANVGRVDLYLLDANDPLNDPVDRGITTKLYSGDAEARLLQEIVLGIGGWRLCEVLSLGATIAHLNEGHAAFAVLERARQWMQRERVSFREALLATRAGNVFTTHTPVAAGFDLFSPVLVEKQFKASSPFMQDLGISPDDLLALGRKNPADSSERFNMAYLATRGCGLVNGVSRLHGEVSRQIFSELFPRWPVEEVPVDHVTNGVHVPSWDSVAADELWTRTCGKGRWLGSEERLADAIGSLSGEQIWAFRSRQRRELVGYARDRYARQIERRGTLPSVRPILDDDILTLGFARRFAEYKRPDLLLRDADRLARLLCDSTRPVQLLIAGKAHPADGQGKELIAQWIEFVHRPELRHRVVFLEDYDITLAEEMTRGVDVWVNTPRRPWEACGTSGMKVLVNGGLNLSELDGWWAEAYSPEVGWALGEVDRPPSDENDAEQLYSLLENEVIPEFYERDALGIPRRWVARIRSSMAQLTPRFSANRMLREYLERIYAPAEMNWKLRTGDGSKVAKELVAWQDNLRSLWHTIRFGEVQATAREGGWQFSVGLFLGDIVPEWVQVELYAAKTFEQPALRLAMKPVKGLSGAPRVTEFECLVTTSRPASDFTPRVVPYHPQARIPGELPLILWQH